MKHIKSIVRQILEYRKSVILNKHILINLSGEDENFISLVNEITETENKIRELQTLYRHYYLSV